MTNVFNELRDVLREAGYEEKEINEIVDLTKHALEESCETVRRVASTASNKRISCCVLIFAARLSAVIWPNIADNIEKEMEE